MKRCLNFSIQLHITERCPNKCLHCYVGESTKEMTYNDFLNVMKKLHDFENENNVIIANFFITGGDPLSNKHCYKIFKYLYNHGRNICILGIPERVNEGVLNQLERYNITKYQMSLDGMKETHDGIRGIGSFDRTIKAIHRLNSHGMDVGIMFTAHENNYFELPHVIEYLNSLRIPLTFAFDFLVNEGNAKSNTISMVNPQTAQCIMKSYYEIAERYKSQQSLVKFSFKNPILRLYKNKMDNIKNQSIGCAEYIYGGCLCGTTSIAILPDGAVYPCRRVVLPIGNIYKDSFSDIIINNPLMKKFRDRNSFIACKNCENYNYCRGCVAISFSWSGNPFAPNPYCFMYEPITIEKSYKNSIDFFEIPYVKGINATDLSKNNISIDLSDKTFLKKIHQILSLE